MILHHRANFKVILGSRSRRLEQGHKEIGAKELSEKDFFEFHIIYFGLLLEPYHHGKFPKVALELFWAHKYGRTTNIS